MKKVAIFIAVIFTAFAYGQKEHFKVQDNELIWQKVYTSELDVQRLHNALRLTPNYNKLNIGNNIIAFEFEYEGKKDLTPFGFKKGKFPSFIWPGGTYAGYIECKEGKYRVTINSIRLIDDYNGELMMHLSEYLVKKGELRTKNRFLKITDLFNRYFEDKFDVKQVVSTW